jgi:hypothetical protein
MFSLEYYSASLAPNTQKTISKILTIWWRQDPFEAKWSVIHSLSSIIKAVLNEARAMLAKAYSILRGNREKEEVPLDEFFNICAPLIGIIPPEEYQKMMGWQLTPAKADDEVCSLNEPILSLKLTYIAGQDAAAHSSLRPRSEHALGDLHHHLSRR